jgi:hypothetical protein
MKCNRQHVPDGPPTLCPDCHAIIEIVENGFWCDYMHPDDKVECECGMAEWRERMER